MSLVAWRIVQRKFVKSAFSGEGARRFGDRWNSPGHAVVYAAQSQALAALEILVHLDSEELLQRYVAIPVTISERLITKVRLSALPKNWRAYPAPPATRSFGDAWLALACSPVLRVPSTIIPSEFNFLLDPTHRLLSKLRIGKPVRFHFDPRLTLSL